MLMQQWTNEIQSWIRYHGNLKIVVNNAFVLCHQGFGILLKGQVALISMSLANFWIYTGESMNPRWQKFLVWIVGNWQWPFLILRCTVLCTICPAMKERKSLSSRSSKCTEAGAHEAEAQQRRSAKKVGAQRIWERKGSGNKTKRERIKAGAQWSGSTKEKSLFKSEIRWCRRWRKKIESRETYLTDMIH